MLFLIRKQGSEEVLYRTSDPQRAQEVLRFYEDNAVNDGPFEVVEVQDFEVEPDQRPNNMFVVYVAGRLSDGAVTEQTISPLPSDTTNTTVSISVGTTEQNWFVDGRFRGQNAAQVQAKVQDLVRDQLGINITLVTNVE